MADETGESNEPEESDDAAWGCIMPFLNQQPAYAYGVEFGRLYEQTKQTDSIDETFNLANQDQILLMFSRLGWKVEQMEVLDEFWFHVAACRN